MLVDPVGLHAGARARTRFGSRLVGVLRWNNDREPAARLNYSVTLGSQGPLFRYDLYHSANGSRPVRRAQHSAALRLRVEVELFSGEALWRPTSCLETSLTRVSATSRTPPSVPTPSRNRRGSSG